MNPATVTTRSAAPILEPELLRREPASRRRLAALPLVLTLAFLALALLPSVRGNVRLLATFLGVGGVLLAWNALLWLRVRRRGGGFPVEVAVVKSHYVQATVQLGILAWWGWHWRGVYAEARLVLAQILFLYVLDALLSWTRGRTWRLGFGPLPIIFSTNLLLWFRDDWFIGQFAMVTLGALGKQFITWERDGRRTHVFNPSVFGQTLVALALIATGTTAELTWGKEIAATFEDSPRILIAIFALGLVVQSFFHVTLMTLAAVGTLCVLNLAYTGATGSYWFVTLNVGATVFLGAHLLITDPSTSPRTNLGRVIFGALYGLGYFLLYRLLEDHGVPLFWDKLLPVGILNLLVPLIDRLARWGAVGRLNRLWETALKPRAMNLVHMGCWCALFGTMVATGFVERPHPGGSLEFWEQAYLEGQPRAGRNLMRMASFEAARDSGPACNVLGMLFLEGKLVEQDRAKAAHWFARASDLGDPDGRLNVVRQFLKFGEWESDATLRRALDELERQTRAGTRDPEVAYLIGFAYESGRGRRPDRARANELYLAACALRHEDACRRLQQR